MNTKIFQIEQKKITVYLPDHHAPNAPLWLNFPDNDTEANALATELTAKQQIVIAVAESDWETAFTPWQAPRLFKNCVVFHSLSKRSNVPGMRSGFVAGDAQLLKPYLLYRTYHGAAMPVQHQLASILAWNDEQHVGQNRIQYRAKFDLFQNELGHLLPLKKPDAGFYYWLSVDDDEKFAKMLMEKAHIKVLVGRYLSRDTPYGNPGKNHVRMALVADLAQCEQAVERLKAIL